MSNDERDFFLQEMADVKPLSGNDRVPAKNTNALTPEQAKQRQQAAAMDNKQDNNPLSLPEEVKQIGSDDIVGLKKNGVQEGVYRKLRLGKYDVQAAIDLHRVKLVDARKQVYEFLSKSHEHSLRTVLITHGKGRHSDKPAIMKSHVIHWLTESDLVLAFHSATKAHGGSGATYALLRKSAQSKQQSREQWQRR